MAPNVVPEDGTSADSATPPSTAVETDQPDAAEPADDESVLQPTDPVKTLPPIPVEQQNIPELKNGDALARLEIPRIGRNEIVVAGVQTSDLKRGPGHFPDTPLPGQLGNSAIAGHRTTYGSPFFNVDKLEVGDEITATTLNGRYTYQVTGQQVVASSEYCVVATTDSTVATLTLTSCHPKYTAQKRIVIFSELVASESAPVGEPVLNYGRPEETDDVDASASETEEPPADDPARHGRGQR